MKYASSIKYGGQLVDAIECDYDDYKRLGLLCPECKDPVFLRAGGTRSQNGKEVKINAHFSHFPGKDPTLVQQCESRVGKYTPKQLQKMAAQARGQRLRLLQKHFWSIMEPYLLLGLKYFKTIDSSTDCSKGEKRETTDALNETILRTTSDEWGRDVLNVCTNYLNGISWNTKESDFLDFFNALSEGKNIVTRVNGEDYIFRPERQARSLENFKKLDIRLHKMICKECLMFLFAKTSQPLIKDVLAYFVDCIFFSMKADPDLQKNPPLGDIRSRFCTLSWSFLLVEIISIPWAEEFAKLEKQSAKPETALSPVA